MFSDILLSGIMPKTFVVAAVGYAAIAYFGAPVLAERVVRADFIPACEANIRTITAAEAERRIADLSMPSIDPSKAIAAASLKALRDSSLMQQLEVLSGDLGMSLGLGELGDMTLSQHMDEVTAAKDAYQRALDDIRNETASRLELSGDLCGCMADAAIADTRTEWAIFAGTLSLVKPTVLEDFDARMAVMYREGACANADRVPS